VGFFATGSINGTSGRIYFSGFVIFMEDAGMSSKVIVALDLGTTGNRAAAFSRDGKVVALAYRKFTQHFPRPGWVEHDPLELYATAKEVLAEVIAKVGVEFIEAIGITNQRETSVLWERSTGKPLYNAIVWQDRRTTDRCRELSGHSQTVKKATGLFIDPYFSATKIGWILDKFDPSRTKASKGDILFGTPETWVLWNLTGGKVHATEPSNASRTMLFNIHTMEWDTNLLKLFNIPPQILPSVHDSDTLFGSTDPSLFGKPLPVTGILGDQQASLFGQMGWDSHIVKATYGTGIFVLMNTGDKAIVSDKLVSTIAWKTREGVRYALEGSLFMGGASIQWLQDNLGLIRDPAETAEASMRVSDNEGVYFVPAFQGLGSPYWDPDARALIIGLSRKSNRDTIIRAAVESLAYQVRDVIDAFTSLLHGNIRSVKVDGGASRNDFLMQFQADLLDVDVIRPAITETTALGAAAIAGISCGFWDRKSFASTFLLDRTFKPSGDNRRFDHYYSGWKEAVSRSLGWESAVRPK
jgi:glycerol kinase